MRRTFLQFGLMIFMMLSFAAVALAQQSANDYVALGDQQIRLKDYDNAFRSQTECIRLYPGEKRCRMRRGLVYQELKKYRLAIADFTEAIRLDPSYGFAYEGRALSYLDLDRFDAAIADAETALKLNPNDQRAKELLEVSWKLKNTTEKLYGKNDGNSPKSDSVDAEPKSVSLIDYETALSNARRQSDPSKYRAKAFVKYHISLKSEGRMEDQVLQFTMQRIKELAEIDFYAVFQVFMDRDLTQDSIGKILALLPPDQKAAVNKMARLFVDNFHLERSGKAVTTLPEHLHKPGYGWGKTVPSN